jgi:hypothetical protein
MRLRLIAVAAGILLAISNTVPAKATIVYVTYTGTVSRGIDPGNVFGLGANLNGQSYSVLYVFDTGSFADNHPTENFVFGGTNFGTLSPLVGAAIITIGGVNIDIGGNAVGEIQGINNGQGAFSEQLHRAQDTDGSNVENSIFNFSGGLPATITTPFVYTVTSSDGGGSGFSAFGASGDLPVTTLVVSLDPPTSAVPEPSTWAMILLGFAGLGFTFRHSKCKMSFA